MSTAAAEPAAPAPAAPATGTLEVRDDGLRPAFTPSSGVGEGTGTGKTVEEILAEDAARSAYMEELGMGKESQMGSPWAKGDVLQLLSGYAETRAHLADPGFLAMVAELSAHPERQRKYMRDPRMMQATARLQGFSISCTEEELREAERKGEIAQRRAPVQMEHLDHAREFGTPDSAKAEGNAQFKARSLNLALACYQWAKALLGRAAAADAEDGAAGEFGGVKIGRFGKDEGWPASKPAARAMELTLELNSTACYLALKLPEDAETSATAVIVAAPKLPAGAPAFDTSKAYYRRCKAREARGKLKEAVADLKDCLTRTQRACDEAHADGGAANPRYKALKLEVARLNAEYRTLQEREHAKWQATQAAKAQAKLDLESEQMRGAGIALMEPKNPEPPKPKISLMELEDSDDEEEEAPKAASAYAPGVVQEKDYSYWFRKELGARLKGVKHRFPSGGIIRTLGLHEASNQDISATVKVKNGKRALFYELDVTAEWVCETVKGRTLKGIVRLYNIAQDTSYCPGGDQNTSWIFSLGYGPDLLQGRDGQELLDEQSDIYEVNSRAIGEAIRELHRKVAPSKSP